MSRVDRLKEFWRRYRQNRAAVLGLGIFIFFLMVAASAPYIAPYGAYDINLGDNVLPPSADHLFGTDLFGRDVLSRLIWGTRSSLFIGFISTIISQLIGVPLGAIAGYYGGNVDSAIMRVVDAMRVIPRFFLIVLIVSVFGSSMFNVMIVIGFTSWPGTARMMRAQFLAMKERMFVEAARSIGAGSRHIIFSEILPNVIYTSIVSSSMRVASAIMTEASLSFLGLGDPAHVSWGWMLNDGRKTFRVAWWASLFPGLLILLVTLSFNLIGDGLNDALNPYLKEK